MTTHLKGKFSISTFDETKQLIVDEARSVSHAMIVQAYDGELAAEVTHELLMCNFSDGTADIVGFSRIVGSIGSHTGSWLEQSIGHFDGHIARSATTIVRGSGTGAFEKISGSGKNWSDKDGGTGYTLDYDLE